MNTRTLQIEWGREPREMRDDKHVERDGEGEEEMMSQLVEIDS